MKARYSAGNAATADSLLKIVENAVYEVPFTQKTEDDIKHMKHRIENERLKPELKYSDIKLGFGGMNDIEFTAQLYQMKEGGKKEKLRIPETVTALHRLGAFGILRISETTRLVETYIFLSQVRNRLALLGGLPTDTLPEDTIRLRTLAIGLGVVDSKTEMAEERLRGIIQERMKEARGIVERLFWGL
jgi:glutamate-ammonia-ligase adenylyltransferase